MKTSIAVVIPTRNRADLAIDAIRSVLAIRDARITVIVSNNSSDPSHVRQLEEFCERSPDVRLTHIRPPQSLTMADHWDWALQQTLARSDASHVAMHYDRRLSKPSLRILLDLTERWSDLPITYLIDVVYPYPPRFHVHPMPWSGAVYEIAVPDALRLAARGGLTDLWQAFPVLVNCVTPRSVLERVRRQFGTICASTSPESCFGFRFSAVDERYLHFDMALAIHYAYARSNGMSYLRGETTGTFQDFLALQGDRPWLEAAPLPGLSLGQNTFYNEYELVRRGAGRGKFPAIEMDGYLQDLARGLFAITDPAKRAEMQELLTSRGWRAPESTSSPEPTSRSRLASRVRTAWLRLRADYLHSQSDAVAAVGFQTEEEALAHAQAATRRPVANNDSLSPLEPIRVGRWNEERLEHTD